MIKLFYSYFVDNKNQWVILASVIACVSILAIICIVIYRNKRCKNRLKDALPCTRSTREPESIELPDLLVPSTDFVVATSKSGEKLLNQNTDQEND